MDMPLLWINVQLTILKLIPWESIALHFSKLQFCIVTFLPVILNILSPVNVCPFPLIEMLFLFNRIGENAVWVKSSVRLTI